MSILSHFTRSLNKTNIPISQALDEIFEGKPLASGAVVSNEGSLTLSAVYACVQIIAGTIATLPLPVYKRLPNGGKERAPTHPLYSKLHDRPNPEMSSVTFRETLVTHLLLWGNAFCEVVRSNGNVPTELWPIHPGRVRIAIESGRKVFWITVNGIERPFTSDDILHIPGLGHDGYIGLSPIQLARETLGLAMATEEFGARFYANSTRLSGILKHPNTLSPEAAKRLRDAWDKQYVGKDNAHKVFVAEEGMDFVPFSVPPNDAQFLETRKFQIAEIARIFHVPLHMIADLDRSTNNNIEHQSIDFVVHTIRPWAVRLEQILNWELFGERSPFFCEFVIDGLLRGDIKSRYEAFAVARQNGVINADEWRELENMNPQEGGQGKAYWIPRNMAPADRIDEVIDAEIKPKPEPVAPPVDDERSVLSLNRIADILDGMKPNGNGKHPEHEAVEE